MGRSAMTNRRLNPRRKTVPPDIIQLLLDGQTKLFLLVEEVKEKISGMGVQGNEISHINRRLSKVEQADEDKEERLSTIETSCIKNHIAPDRREPPAEKPFGRRLLEGVIMAVVISTVLLLCSILGFTMFVNTQAFMDFQHTQIDKTPKHP
jgi:hypothetical protein